MATYSEEDRTELMKVPVEDVLKAFGCSTVHGHDGLYFSPFRRESAPSFHISRDGSRWYDFGTGHGGTVLTLVCKLLNCSGGKGYDFLAGLSSTLIVSDQEQGPAAEKSESRTSHRIIVTDARPAFRDRTLIAYAAGRGISEAVLRDWCREVTFTYEGHPRYRNSAIGFLNDAGGWVLRAQDVKKCTCSEISTIDIYGGHSDSPTSPSGIMFEGMFDFLSWMEISGGGWPKSDVCVLNSVTNVRKAQSWIEEHSRISTLFDNDDAGRKALQQVRDLKAAQTGGDMCVIVNDWSDFYSGYGDLNARLSKERSNLSELTIQSQSLWNRTFQKTFRRD